MTDTVDMIPDWLYNEEDTTNSHHVVRPLPDTDQIPFTNPCIVRRVYQLAKTLHDVFTSCELHYWTSGGTTLGCIRHQGLIPWDDDIDICIYAEDVEDKLLCAAKTLLNDNCYEIVEAPDVGYRIYHKTDSDELPSCSTHRYPFCDIFTMKCKWVNQNYRRYVIADARGRTLWPNEFYSVEETRNIKQKSYGDFVLNCPGNAEAYLDRYYGNSWRTEGHTSSYDHITRSYIKSFRFSLTEELLQPAIV